MASGGCTVRGRIKDAPGGGYRLATGPDKAQFMAGCSIGVVQRCVLEVLEADFKKKPANLLLHSTSAHLLRSEKRFSKAAVEIKLNKSNKNPCR